MSLLLTSWTKNIHHHLFQQTNCVESVVVIGAGAAGLSAAHDLVEDDHFCVTIFKASDQIGGRLKKDETLTDFPIDLGGEFIHVDPNVLNIIANCDHVTDKIDVVPYNVSPIYEYWDDDGEFYPYNYKWNDHKFVDYTWFDFFIDYVAYDVIDKIVFNCPVDRIDYQGDMIQIKCSASRQVFEANYAVVAVPTQILKEGDITFVPKLPKRFRKSLPKVTNPEGIKVFLKFLNQFYYSGFEHAADWRVEYGERYFYDATYGQDTDMNILGVYAHGIPAQQYTLLENDSEIIVSILDELDQMFGQNKANNAFTGFAVVQNWEKEPYICGSFLEYLDGYAALRKLARPIQDYIYFAGKAILVDWEHGFAH